LFLKKKSGVTLATDTGSGNVKLTGSSRNILTSLSQRRKLA